MEQERILRLVVRQLQDIHSQADKILSGDKSNEALELFGRYSIDLKEYIAKNINNEKIISYLTEIPDVKYSRSKVRLWEYLILPSWWIIIYKDYIRRNKTLKEVNIARGKYAHLELLMKSVIS